MPSIGMFFLIITVDSRRAPESNARGGNRRSAAGPAATPADGLGRSRHENAAHSAYSEATVKAFVALRRPVAGGATAFAGFVDGEIVYVRAEKLQVDPPGDRFKLLSKGAREYVDGKRDVFLRFFR